MPKFNLPKAVMKAVPPTEQQREHQLDCESLSATNVRPEAESDGGCDNQTGESENSTQMKMPPDP